MLRGLTRQKRRRERKEKAQAEVYRLESMGRLPSDARLRAHMESAIASGGSRSKHRSPSWSQDESTFIGSFQSSLLPSHRPQDAMPSQVSEPPKAKVSRASTVGPKVQEATVSRRVVAWEQS